MKTLLVTFLVAPLIMVLAFGATEEETVKALTEGNNAFALNLYSQLSSEKGNLFFSPYSISTALAMCCAGAQGNTKTEITKIAGFDKLEKEVHPAFSKLNSLLNLNVKQDRCLLSNANALWKQKGHPFLPEFISTFKKYYENGFFEADFAGEPEDTAKTINQWVENNTGGKIKELVSLDMIQNAYYLIANAVYFKGSWEKPFKPENTREAPFTLGDGTKVNVQMMDEFEKYWYYSNDDVQVVALLYEGKRLSMFIFLPKENKSLSDFEKSLTAEMIQKIAKELKYDWVKLLLPKFEIEFNHEFKKILISMGIKDAFTVNANFSGFDGRKGIPLIQVLHKAVVSVDEKGTEAAAATAVPGGWNNEFNANRPFVFVIRDNTTGSILFMGRMMDPRK
jgi:serine protease inhibitor